MAPKFDHSKNKIVILPFYIVANKLYIT